MNKLIKVLICISVLLNSAAGAKAADVYLSLSSHGQRSAIGLAGFCPETPSAEEAQTARHIKQVLVNDLLFSRYFDTVEGGIPYTGKASEIKAWADAGAAAVVAGKLKITGYRVSVTVQLYVSSDQIVFEKKFEGYTASYRNVAHRINDEIVKYFTGEKGIAQSRIVFSNSQSSKKELYVADYDGFNLKRLTHDKSIDILPRWSPDGGEIVYTTFFRCNPDLYGINPENGRKRKISADQGINSSGNYSPDGEMIALTKSRGAYPNIFLIDRSGKTIRQLTYGRSIQTSPSFAPNGREIVYISDESGIPQLYILDVDTGSSRRIYTEGIADSPQWSPRGDKIVFAMRIGRDNYNIFVYDLATTNVTQLTQEEGSNENPSWSPDGRFVVFSSTRSSIREIYLMAIDGTGVRKLVTMLGNSYTPGWSR